MRQLIVNADDFGLTRGINRAIIEAHECGIVTSTTIMVNMSGFEEAVQMAKAQPSLGVGLHFNITQGRPVAPIEKVRSLLTRKNEFPGTSTAIARRLLTGGLKTEEVVIELRAQIEKARNAGLKLTHLDSHKHSHALPQVFAAILRTIPDYGIRAVRLQRERTHLSEALKSPAIFKQSAVAAALSLLCRNGQQKMRDSGLFTTDNFYGIAQTGYWTQEWINQLMDSLPEGVSELMCHPGYVDLEMSQAGTRLLHSRQQELHLLVAAESRRLIEARQITLINYSHLPSLLDHFPCCI
jgi:hopanoid biosynthesis associated protein HpnK